MKNVIIAAFAGLFLCQCANIVPPSGGPKDQEAPKLLSTEANGKKAILTFNENIQLKNKSDFYVSPPLASFPKLNTQRNLLMLEGEWQEGESYAIHFPSVIADYNEGNLIEDLQILIPSNTTDTFSLKGSIKQSLKNEAVEGAWAALYLYNVSNRDSALFLSPPNYIAKTDKNGVFAFPNLLDTTYWLFALSDEDRNLKYNLPEEHVGFYSQAVSPYDEGIEISLFNEHAKPDSLSPLTIDSTSSFGKLIVDSLPQHHILELLLGDKIIKRMSSASTLTIDSLSTNTYQLRLIQDKNKNGVWDSGSLAKREQAEAILYYPEEIQLRENWDLEISWK